MIERLIILKNQSLFVFLIVNKLKLDDNM